MKKRVLMLVVCAMLSGGLAQAFVFDASDGIDFTGKNTELAGDVGGFALLPGDLSGYIGGQGGNGTIGYASQFRLDQETYLSKISFDMSIHNLDHNFNRGVDFDFLIYKGNNTSGGFYPVPDINNIIYRSTPVQLSFDVERVRPDGTLVYTEDKSYSGLEKEIGKTLDSGDYWLAYERGRDLPGMDFGKFNSAKLEGTVTTPEPASLLLFGAGLAGFFGVRRRR